MKLTNEEIRYIDRWLRFSGIEYLDVRYELVDHLITEYERSADDLTIESFVKERLSWCKLAAKKKGKSMHWGIQKGLWRRFLSLFKELKIVLPLLAYLLIIFISKDQFSTRTVRLLLLAPVFLTIIIFLFQQALQNFGKKYREQILAIQKLGSLFALPQFFLGFFYFPSIWSIGNDRIIDNAYFMLPCVFVMTMFNVAAIFEYTDRYKKIVKEFKFFKGELA